MIKKLMSMVVLSLILIGCSPADIEGVIIQSEADILLIATELTLDEYDQIKYQSAMDIQNNDLAGDSFYGLMDIHYDKAEEFEDGEYVEVWITGDVQDSYPSRAKAKKVTLAK